MACSISTPLLNRVLQAVSDAKAAADVQIIKYLIERPQLYSEGCAQASQVVSNLLAALPQYLVSSTVGRVRTAVAFQEAGLRKSLRLTYSFGFEEDADEGIILPIVGSVIGEAWTDLEPVFKTAPFQPLVAPAGYRRLNKLFAKDINWICAVPIPRSGQINEKPAFVVALDGSALLSNDISSLKSLLDVISLEIEKIFTPMAEALETN